MNYIAGAVIILLAVGLSQAFQSTNRRIVQAVFPPRQGQGGVDTIAPDEVRLRWVGPPDGEHPRARGRTRAPRVRHGHAVSGNGLAPAARLD
jgi:hypothetical protein